MSDVIRIIDRTDRIESLLAPFRSDLGAHYDAYRGHVYRTTTYAMHFLGGNDAHRAMVETTFVYHDIGLWTDDELAYLEPSEELAIRDNEAQAWGLDPEILRAAIHWHHKITAYKGVGAEVVNAVRKADWIDASQGMVRKGLNRAQVAAVLEAIPDPGFGDVLQELARDLGGNALRGNLRVLRRVVKF